MDLSQDADRERTVRLSDNPDAGPAEIPGPPRSAAATGPARPRLTWNRLDLAIKLLQLECALGSPSAFVGRLYDDHLAAMTAGPAGGSGPAGPTEPRLTGAELVEACMSLRDNGADPDGGRVVLASDGSVLTGAHLAASAMFLDRSIPVEETDLTPVVHDARFFESRGLDGDQLDAAVVRFVEGAPDCFVALIWPAAQGGDEEIDRILAPVVYRRSVTLGPNGAHNLLARVYAGEPWLGDPARNYPGIRNKLVPCFSRNAPLRVVVFQKPSLADAVAAKEAIREVFGIGKHAIHVTDTHEEAVMVARLLLNQRGVHFLNAAQPSRFPSTLTLVEGFEGFLRRKGIPPEQVAVDSGMVLAAYGLREAQDVDFVSPVEIGDEGLFSRHGAGAHQLPVGDLLHDPRNHFHYWGLKLVSLEQVARMKARRRVGRDLDDLRLIGPVLAAGSRHPRLRLLTGRLRFLLAKGRRRAIQATMRLGLYGPLKAAQRRLRRGT